MLCGGLVCCPCRAENGCFYRSTDREWFTLSTGTDADSLWYDAVLKVLESFTERTEGPNALLRRKVARTLTAV